MSNPSFLDLLPEEAAHLDRARVWVKGHFAQNEDESYASSSERLHCIQVILDQGWIEPSETWKLQALGIALGDSVAEKLMMKWVTVEDETGRDPALQWPGTQTFCFPMTMISKRIEDGEDVDVQYLFERACEIISEEVFSGKSI